MQLVSRENAHSYLPRPVWLWDGFCVHVPIKESWYLPSRQAFCGEFGSAGLCHAYRVCRSSVDVGMVPRWGNPENVPGVHCMSLHGVLYA